MNAFRAAREAMDIEGDVKMSREEKMYYLAATLQKTVENGKSTQEEVNEILEAFGIDPNGIDELREIVRKQQAEEQQSE